MSVLGDYYRAQIEEAGARTGLIGVQTGSAVTSQNQIAADGAARRALEGAQAGAAQAGAVKTGLEAGQVGADASARRGLEGAQTSLFGNQAGVVAPNAQSEIASRNAGTQGQILSNLASPLKTASGLATDALQRQGYAYQNLPSASLGPATDTIGSLGGTGSTAGISGGGDPTKIQGDETGGMILNAKDAALGKAKKPGPTDTVPVMLTPGEAVLNKGAADHYGPALIEHMNKMGLMRMGAQTEAAKHLGLPDPHAPPSKSPVSKSPAPKAAPPQAKSAGKATSPAGSLRNGKTGTRKVGSKAA